MLGALFTLLALSTVMAIASFLAGSLPLSFSLSQSQLRLISTIGMGVLVGTSLIVIIPEGVETLYSASVSVHTNQGRHLDMASLDVRWNGPERYPRGEGQTRRVQGFVERDNDDRIFNELPGPVIPADIPLPNTDPAHTSTSNTHAEQFPPGAKSADTSSSPSTTPPSTKAPEPRTPHVWIGISLILGFILMYLIDTLPRSITSRPSSPPRPRHFALEDLSRSPYRTSPSRNGARSPSPSADDLSSQQPSSRSLATTTGLVIHAAADGIALGASSTSSSTPTRLSLIIFLAIMLHKAPAAFGLTSVLLKQGLTKRAAKAHLVVFSLAAPAGALLTWGVVHVLSSRSALTGATTNGRLVGGSGDHDDGDSTKFWVGVTLLFSAGTFLYVAMHAMQEDQDGHTHGSDPSHQDYANGYATVEGGSPNGHHHHGGGQKREGTTSMKLTLAAVGGMLLPLLTQFGHHH